MRRLTLLVAFIAALGLIAAAPSSNDFRFAILGDRTGDAQPGVYEQIWREVDAGRPDFVINVGDTIQGVNDATAASEWRALLPLWSRHRYPMYFTPGNHDIWSAETRAVYEKQTGRPAFYSFDFQNAHFIVLDNSRVPDLSFDLPADQMQFLERDLERSRDRNPKFVFFHKPLWLIPVKLQDSRFAFHQLMTKYGVGFVVSGHGHEYVREMLDGVTYLEAPSSGGKLKGQGFDQGWFYGHLEVTVKGSMVDIIAREIGPPLGQGRVITAGRSKGALAP
ncbi:MAG TPA: metallophosphoesterase [Bryobacteraceae bacterium]|nr:metallophosphoesterase [Bryobacteraceae bacterium]